MGYTTHRRSSAHYTTEATLGIRIGVARRVSYAERSSQDFAFSQRSNNSGNKTKTYPCYHRITVPEPSPPAYTSLHAFCVATDATYARLSARLDHLRGHKADVAFYVREQGERRALGQVLEGLRHDERRLEKVLEGMRCKIEQGEGGWDESGKVFLVGGRWAAFV